LVREISRNRVGRFYCLETGRGKAGFLLRTCGNLCNLQIRQNAVCRSNMMISRCNWTTSVVA
jgi:hypothetical protein